jgi:hypothetical protein
MIGMLTLRSKPPVGASSTWFALYVHVFFILSILEIDATFQKLTPAAAQTLAFAGEGTVLGLC